MLYDREMMRSYRQPVYRDNRAELFSFLIISLFLVGLAACIGLITTAPSEAFKTCLKTQSSTVCHHSLNE